MLLCEVYSLCKLSVVEVVVIIINNLIIITDNILCAKPIQNNLPLKERIYTTSEALALCVQAKQPAKKCALMSKSAHFCRTV